MSLTFIRRPPGLQFGGLDVRQLADRAGRTPFFAYDRSAIDTRVRELRSLLPSGMHLHYSIKANPMPAVIHYLAERVDGFDVASAQEMALALDAGTSPKAIASPGRASLTTTYGARWPVASIFTSSRKPSCGLSPPLGGSWACSPTW